MKKNILYKLAAIAVFSLASPQAFAEECTTTPDCATIGFPYTAEQCAAHPKIKCPFGEKYFCAYCDNSQGFYDTCPTGARCSERNSEGCVVALGCDYNHGYFEDGEGEWDAFETTGDEYTFVERYGGNSVYEITCYKANGCRSDVAVTRAEWEANYKEWLYEVDWYRAENLECVIYDYCREGNGYYHECPSNMVSMGTKTFINGYTCHQCRCSGSGAFNVNNADYEKIREATLGSIKNGCYVPTECDNSKGWIGYSNGDQVGEDGNNYDFEDIGREYYEYDDSVGGFEGGCIHVVGCAEGYGADDEGIAHFDGPGYYEDSDFGFACYDVKGCDTEHGWLYTNEINQNPFFIYGKTVSADGYSCTKFEGCRSPATATKPSSTSPYIWSKETTGGKYSCYVPQACNVTRSYYNLTGGPSTWYCPNSTTKTATPVDSNDYIHCGSCTGTGYGTKTCSAAGFYASLSDCEKHFENQCRLVYGTSCYTPMGDSCSVKRANLASQGLKGYVYENLYADGFNIDIDDEEVCWNGCGINEGYIDTSTKPLLECIGETNTSRCRNKYNATIQCSETVTASAWNGGEVVFKKVCVGSTCCPSIDWNDIQSKMTLCRNAGGNFEYLYINTNSPINVNALSN